MSKQKILKTIYIGFLIINILLMLFQLRISNIIRDGSCYGVGYVCQESESVIQAANFMDNYLNLFLAVGLIFIIYSIFYLIFKIKTKTSIPTILLIILSLFLTPVTQYVYETVQNAMSDSANMSIDKPMIYIYPKEDNTNVKIKLSNDKLITHSYPKYANEWNVIVSKNGNIYDSKTKRNYYGLYWEGIDNSEIDTKTGFVVKGENTVDFLEEKLEILGLNEREINEFIVYWLPKLENNKYNYIRFRTYEEINDYMKIESNIKIDSLIRVYMDYKPLDKKVRVVEQKLNKKTRQGFTIVEWGGRKLS